MTTSSADARHDLVRRGLYLNYLTIAYNALEAAASVVVGTMAGSIALVGFGADSVIELAASVAAQWRLRADVDARRREDVERRTHRAIGWSFITLGAYIIYESGRTLWYQERPEGSVVGIVVLAGVDRGHAPACPGEASRRTRPRESSTRERSDADVALRVLVRDRPCRGRTQHALRLVVRRFGCRTGHGTDHRSRRHREHSRARVRGRLPLRSNRPFGAHHLAGRNGLRARTQRVVEAHAEHHPRNRRGPIEPVSSPQPRRDRRP